MPTSAASTIVIQTWHSSCVFNFSWVPLPSNWGACGPQNTYHPQFTVKSKQWSKKLSGWVPYAILYYWVHWVISLSTQSDTATTWHRNFSTGNIGDDWVSQGLENVEKIEWNVGLIWLRYKTLVAFEYNLIVFGSSGKRVMNSAGFTWLSLKLRHYLLAKLCSIHQSYGDPVMLTWP